MNAIKTVLPYSPSNPWWRFVFIGDIHAGSKACDEALLRRDIKQISKDLSQTIVFTMGDLGEFIGYHDKRYDPQLLMPWVFDNPSGVHDAQKEWIATELAPLRDAIKRGGSLMGNHEKAVLDRYEHDIHTSVVGKLDAPDLGYSSLIKYVFYREDNRKTCYAYLVHLHHGFGAGTKTPGVVSTLQSLMIQSNARICAMGHRHRLAAIKEDLYTFVDGRNGPDIGYTTRAAVCSGSYLRSMTREGTTYSEQGGMSPATLGHVEIHLNVESGEMRLVI